MVGSAPASTTLDQLVEQSIELYSLPGVAVRVLELTRDPQVDVAALKACIENDPALASKILRVVNSSLFGLSRQVSDLNQALALLGVKPLKLLVLGFSLPDRLFRDVAGDVLGSYWRRTLTRAVAARELADRMWGIAGDEALIVGLLKDLGLLVLVKELGRSFAEFWRRVTREAAPLLEAERRALGFDHVQLTERLLESWALPPQLVDAVAAPADPMPRDTAGGKLATAVELADMLTELLIQGRPEMLADVLATETPQGRLSDNELAELAEILEQKVASLAEVLRVELDDLLAYRDVLAEAHRQLVAAASDAAGEVVRSQYHAWQARLDRLSLLDEVRQLGDAVEAWSSRRAAVPPGKAIVAPVAGPPTQPIASRPTVAVAPPRTLAKEHLRPANALPPAPIAHDDVEPHLGTRLAAAVSSGRQMRRAVSVLLVELDHFGELAFVRGPHGAAEVFELLHRACHTLDHPLVVAMPVAEARLAVILTDCDRREAVDLGHDLLRFVREHDDARHAAPATASVGVASLPQVPKNFPPGELYAAAQRCLHGAQLSGGNTLKSIEL